MGKVTALLGPTNTGKTHLAVERMLDHPTGVIGFPLRLLARENYEKLKKLRGPDQVALVTGEEKIVPPSARFFVCTVESMPIAEPFDFLAVDEIQLCADRERGHVFTDRLLHARGVVETMFLGADTIRGLVRRLVPAAEMESRPRFSVLSHTGPKKLVKLPPRTAVVAFSVADVYAIAELLRRHKGGTAVVLGALSPRTRNAQVRMYQDGQVDHLVATDAIGMGLNLDVEHVAFAALSKFDGEDVRELVPAELAQIAGRAGRFLKDGTFGTTHDARGLPQDVVEAIEQHRFAPLQSLVWRSSDLDFDSIDDLHASLTVAPPREELQHGRVADDLRALRLLASLDEVRAAVRGPDDVRLLWEVCQVPDFRKISAEDHARILLDLWRHLSSTRGRLPRGFVEQRLVDLARIDGDVEDLVARLAFVRTWSYVAFRGGWLVDAAAAQEKARDAEDRLSDALHEALARRFVDRLSSAMHKSSRTGAALDARVDGDGAVVVAGASLGRLAGLRFVAADAPREEAKLFGKAAAQALRQRVQDRVQELVDDADDAFALLPDGTGLPADGPASARSARPIAVVRWRDEVVAALRPGADVLRPIVEASASTLLDPKDLARVRARAAAYVDATLRARLAPLYALAEDERLDGAARGVGYQLKEGLGAIRRAQVGPLIDAMEPPARKAFAATGARIGFFHVYVPALAKSAAVEARWLLAALRARVDPAPPPPPTGTTSFPVDGRPRDLLLAAGYETLGARAYRVDMLERVAVIAKRAAQAGPFAAPAEVCSLLGASNDEAAVVLQFMGYAVDDAGLWAPKRGGRRRGDRPRRDGRGDAAGLGTLGDVAPRPKA